MNLTFSVLTTISSKCGALAVADDLGFLPDVAPWLSKPQASQMPLPVLVRSQHPSAQTLDYGSVMHESIDVTADLHTPSIAATSFYQEHPVFTSVGVTLALAALAHNYGFCKSEPKIETKVMDEFKTHYDGLLALQNELYQASPDDVPNLFGQIAKKLVVQASVYEEKVREFDEGIVALKQKSPRGADTRAQILAITQAKNAVLRAYQRDLAFLDGLMESWYVRQLGDSHMTLRLIEERYFKTEGNPIKTVPMYAVNFLNTFSTVMIGTMIMLSVYNTALPYFFHDNYPDLISEVADPHAHWQPDSLVQFFKDISYFSLVFDLFYTGSKGLRSRNTNNAVSQGWNRILDTVAWPYCTVVEPFVVGPVDRLGQALAGRVWEMGARYLYRGTSLGVAGILRQVGRDMKSSLNGLATGLARKTLDKDAAHIRPFGKFGEATFGQLFGGLLDWSVGVFENVMQNVIVKMPGNSIGVKIARALEDPEGLVLRNAAPSFVVNLIHAQATVRVTQYPGNDDMDVVISRFVLGVIKGSLFTALIATPAINATASGATGLYLGAQVVIGGNSIFLSLLLTSPSVRQAMANAWARVRHR